MAKFDYGRYFGEITPLADVLRENEERFWEPGIPEASRKHEYALYLGCNVLRTVNLAESVVAVLKAMGVDFAPIGGFSACCGIVHHANGDFSVSEKLTANSLDKLSALASREVLVYCPSCHFRMNEVLPGRFSFSLPYRHVTDFLAERLEDLRLEYSVPRKVALHHHPFTRQQEDDAAAVLTLLRAIPGLEVEEIPAEGDWGRHCSPQTIDAVGRPRYERMVEEQFSMAKSMGCDALVTVYHSCYRELCGFEEPVGLECLNYIELVSLGMGLERIEPKYKQLKNERNPQAAYGRYEPVAERRGINPKRVRAAMETQFAPRKG